MLARKRCLMLVSAMVAAILLTAGLAVAQALITDFTGNAWMIAPPSNGDVNCIGGTPTGGWPVCTPGSKIQIRGMILTYRQVARKPDGSPEPRMTGIRTINYNFKGTGGDSKSHAWGTWRIVLDGGLGEWEGTFTGFGGAVPNQGQIVGHGTEGQVEGLQLRAAYSYQTGFPGLETIEGFILNPGGQK